MNPWKKSQQLRYHKAKPVSQFFILLMLIATSQNLCTADDQAEARLDSMTASEKRDVKRKRDQFDRLPSEEQTRIRELHAEIETHQNAEQLLAVVTQYSEWLKTLSASQRTDLLSLPVDQRLHRIREIKQRSEEDRFGRFTRRNIHPEDARQMFGWIDDVFIAGKQDQLEAMLDDRQRQMLMMLSKKDPDRRRSHLIRMLYHRTPKILEKPSPEQIEELVMRLSPEAKQEFQGQESDERKQQLVSQWIQAACASRLPPPPVNPNELQRYFAEDLRPQEREDLERMPRDRMYRELGRMYFRDHMKRDLNAPGVGGPPFRRGDWRRHDQGRRGEPDRDGRRGRPNDRRGRGRRSTDGRGKRAEDENPVPAPPTAKEPSVDAATEN
ncbi:MAG: hypothetical protein P8N76_14380 [Pirellulaceae bacterium]|nr:hypothetical protein [Pirellulaceae bacterium]